VASIAAAVVLSVVATVVIVDRRVSDQLASQDRAIAGLEAVTTATFEITAQGFHTGFEIDDYTRWRLMEGLDDIGLTLRHVDRIDEFERGRAPYKPKTLPAKVASRN
jgi:3-isopropylmalate/(R)-2-methylmalate dehydratase small subunit